MKTYIYSFFLICVDVFVLFLSLGIATFFRTNLLNDMLPSFNTTEVQKYYWIILMIISMFVLEKIYIIRYDFWSDTKRVFKGCALASPISNMDTPRNTEKNITWSISLLSLIAVKAFSGTISNKNCNGPDSFCKEASSSLACTPCRPT